MAKTAGETAGRAAAGMVELAQRGLVKRGWLNGAGDW